MSDIYIEIFLTKTSCSTVQTGFTMLCADNVNSNSGNLVKLKC